jgi:DNA-binding NarL/FixJ family response regulator
VLSAVPIQIAVIDRKGLVVAANDSWDESARRRGLAPGRQQLTVGGNYLEACRLAAKEGHDDARDALIGIGSVLSGSLPQFSAQYEAPAEGGESRWFLMTVTPLRADDGAVIALTDVTSLKLGERAIAEAETHERGLLQNLPDQMARMTSDGGVVEVLAPTLKSPMVPPLPPTSNGRNLRDLLPAAAVENLLQTIQDATRANRVAICKFALSYEDDERQYETRVVPLSTREVLVFVRDRTSEQWAAAQTAGNGDGPWRRARIAPHNPYGLTFREAAVLELMAHGAADKEIATQLGVSVFTVNKHVSKILRKMDASSRTEASTRTLREGLLD